MKDTDKYVEEKAQEAHKKFALKHYDFHGIWIKDMEDFILSIIKDFQPKVDEKFVKVWAMAWGHDSKRQEKIVIEYILRLLKNAGVEVSDER